MKTLPIFSSLIALAAAIPASAADRPNILFCFSDDWGRYANIYRNPDRPPK